MRLEVHEGKSTASGASYYVNFAAEIDLVGPVGARLQLGPNVRDGVADYDDSQVEPTAEVIRAGMDEVLRARGLGADILLESIRFHPIDHKSHQFQRVAAVRLAEMLDEESSA